MKNFDVFAASPENLGKFLGTLTVINSPWEDEFHKAFCADCAKTDCTVCPHETERENPLWWLMREFVAAAECQETDRRYTEKEAAKAIIDAAISQIIASAKRDSEGKPGENPEDGKCMDFNVYLGRKDQGGIQLRGVEKVVFPEVRECEAILPAKAELKLTFRSMEYADAVIRALDRMCTIEIRAAVHNLIPPDGWVFHGNYSGPAGAKCTEVLKKRVRKE